MLIFLITNEQYTRLHDGHKQSLCAAIQGESRDSPLENPYREKVAIEFTNLQIQSRRRL